MAIDVSDGDLAATATSRVPLSDEGASGATLERLTFADGSILILKSFSAEHDWTMRATHDTGRAAELWVNGAMDRLPAAIDPAIVRIERDGPSWRLYLHDVSEHFLRRGSRPSRDEVRRFLDAVASMHAAYRDSPPQGLVSIEDLLLLASPATVEREGGAHSPFLAAVREGWLVFDELVPSDVCTAVHGILAAPRRLADALRAGGTTLVHADLHYGNVAPAPDRFYVIDWALAAAAPPAVDVAWYLDQSAALLDIPRDGVLELFAEAEASFHDPRTLRLALLAELILAGWQYLAARDAPEEAARAERRADLDWWVARAREGLEALG